MNEEPAPAPVKANIWGWLSEVYHTFKQARFSIIVTLLAIPVFLYVDQGVELVRAIGEGDQYTGAFRLTQWIHIIAVLVGLLLWGLNSWYWARVTLDLHSPDGVPADRLHESPIGGMIEHIPRILGILPLAIFAAACIRVEMSYKSGSPSGPKIVLGILIGICLVLMFLLYWFFKLRRVWLDKRGVKSIWKNDEEPVHRVQGMRNADADTKLGTWGMFGIAIVLFLLFLISPVSFPKTLGSAAILAFAAAVWICVGSFFVAWTVDKRVPIISLMLVWVMFWSCFNDNHPIRSLQPATDSRPSLRDALKTWSEKMDYDYPDETHHYMFIATASGGGIRAAYWTATVLGTLQDKSVDLREQARKSGQKVPPDFASHLFAISGVSGGSLGAAAFVGGLIESSSSAKITQESQDMLGEDYLSPALAALLNRDFLARFSPVPIPSWDRGRALEEAWEYGWRHKVDSNTDRFAKSLGDLYASGTSGPWVPMLFLNSTSVEAGRRIIASSVEIDPPGGPQDFDDAADASAELGGFAMRLSTAAHLSARFTYVSPAGLFPDGQHAVDGGYFENSGETTAWDILRTLMDLNFANPNKIVPIIIEISNGPGESNPGDVANFREYGPGMGKSVPEPFFNPMPLHGFISDTLAPVYSMLDTRDARGTYSQMLVRKAGYSVKEFSVMNSDIPLPLGWMLSGGAAQEMQNQIGGGRDPSKVNRHDTAMISEVMWILAHPGGERNPAQPPGAQQP